MGLSKEVKRLVEEANASNNIVPSLRSRAFDLETKVDMSRFTHGLLGRVSVSGLTVFGGFTLGSLIAYEAGSKIGATLLEFFAPATLVAVFGGINSLRMWNKRDKELSQVKRISDWRY